MPEDLYVSYLSGDPVVAYMAIQFKGVTQNGGWLPTTWGEEFKGPRDTASPKKRTDSLPVDTGGKTPANGPSNFAAWGPITGIDWSIGREYASGTFGGARTAYRPDLSNVEIEREVDQISPFLMEYAASGAQLALVHILHQVRKTKKSKTEGSSSAETEQTLFETVSWLQLTNVLVSKYTYGTKAEQGKDGAEPTITHYENLELNYSTIVFISNTTSKTWAKNDAPIK